MQSRECCINKSLAHSLVRWSWITCINITANYIRIFLTLDKDIEIKELVDLHTAFNVKFDIPYWKCMRFYDTCWQVHSCRYFHYYIKDNNSIVFEVTVQRLYSTSLLSLSCRYEFLALWTSKFILLIYKYMGFKELYPYGLMNNVLFQYRWKHSPQGRL